MEEGGFEPPAFRMQSEHSAPELHPLLASDILLHLYIHYYVFYRTFYQIQVKRLLKCIDVTSIVFLKTYRVESVMCNGTILLNSECEWQPLLIELFNESSATLCF